MELSLPRDPRLVTLVRHVISRILADLRAPADARDDIELAVTEACDNAVRHATSASQYQVALRVSTDGCEVEIADPGPGLDPAALSQATDGDPEEEESGRGLGLMQALVDDVTLVGHEKGTRLRLNKRWSPRHQDIARVA